MTNRFLSVISVSSVTCIETQPANPPFDSSIMHDEHNGSIARLGAAIDKIKEQLSRVIVGQHDVIEQMLIALFGRGHCLLEGVPGLAKTLLVSTLARSLDLSFSRIQFTPDCMPADITGTDI